MQCLVDFDSAATVAITKSIRFGIDDSSFDVPQIIVATITMTGDDTGMRQLTRDGIF